jgi:hypothetical protein
MTDKIDPARWWRMNWLRSADNRARQNKSLKEELHENAIPSPVRPPTPLPRYSAVRQNTTPPIQYNNSNDGMFTGAMLGYWAASGSSSSSSSDSSCDSSSSDSGSFGGSD